MTPDSATLVAIRISLVDTPGLSETVESGANERQRSDADILKLITDFLNQQNIKFDVVVYCSNLISPMEDINNIDQYLMSAEIQKHVRSGAKNIYCITRSEDFDNNKKNNLLSQLAQFPFSDLIKKSNMEIMFMGALTSDNVALTGYRRMEIVDNYVKMLNEFINMLRSANDPSLVRNPILLNNPIQKGGLIAPYQYKLEKYMYKADTCIDSDKFPVYENKINYYNKKISY